MRHVFFSSMFVFLLLALTVPGAVPATESESGKPQTTADPEIPLDELALKLRPLTRAELRVEADAWQKILQAKVREISTAEIAAKHKRAELTKAEEIEEALQEVKDAQKAADQAPADKATTEKLEKARQAAEQSISEAKDLVNKLEQDKEAEKIAELAVRKGEEKARADVEEGGSDVSADRRAEGQDAQRAKDQQVEDAQLDKAEQDVKEAVESREKTRRSLLEYLNELRAQQTALVDRTNAVIDALEAKGETVEVIAEYRQYVQAVSGVKVDVSDVEATVATVVGWLTSEEGGLRWLKNIIAFVVTVLVFMLLAHLITKALEKVLARSRQASKLLGDFLIVSIRRIVIAVGVIIGLAAMEVNIGPLLAVIGAAGFVIAFALQDSLGNFASGILVLVFRPFDVGDVVQVGGVLGTVQAMNLLSIQIRTPDNKAVIIPNNNVWSDAITNVTGTNTRRVDLVFGIGYGDDIEKAQRILEEVVAAHEMVLKEPQAVIRVHELADSSVNFVCRPWCKTKDYWDVYWDLTRMVKERFDKEGITIPFPQRDVHLFNALPEG